MLLRQLVITITLLSAAYESYASQQNQPNIIVILADDVSPDKFSFFAQKEAVNTPNIDALAKRGVAFETAYATAMCGPSRVQIMTGRYPEKTGVYQNGIWKGDSRQSVYSNFDNFVQVAKQAGYVTGITGKWNAGEQFPTEPSIGFDEYNLWKGEKSAKGRKGITPFNGAYEDADTPSRYWHPLYTQNGKRLVTTENDYGVDLETEFAMDFVKRHKDKPFLLYWPTVAPHGTRLGMPTTPHRGKPGEMGKTGKQETAARFDALIEYLDFSVGRLVKQLTDLSLLDNTVIIFTSDNGTAVTAKTRGIERGVQVVSIMAGPTIKARGATRELMDFTDIAPTIQDIVAKQNVSRFEFDGNSLWPFLQGKVDETRPWIYGYISGSQIFRTQDYLLEAVNTMMGVPNGRLYATGDQRFQHDYKLLQPGTKEYTNAFRLFKPLLKQFPPLKLDDPYFKTKKGKRFLKSYMTKSSREKHLYNHKDYQRYDETFFETTSTE